MNPALGAPSGRFVSSAACGRGDPQQDETGVRIVEVEWRLTRDNRICHNVISEPCRRDDQVTNDARYHGS